MALPCQCLVPCACACVRARVCGGSTLTGATNSEYKQIPRDTPTQQLTPRLRSNDGVEGGVVSV